MLSANHKEILAQLAHEHAQQLEGALRLARAHFSEQHLTVRSLRQAFVRAQEVEQAVRAQPTRRSA